MILDWDEEFDYHRESSINLDQLELEAQDQSDLYWKYGKEKVRLSKMVANTVEEIKVTRSLIIKEQLQGAADNNMKPPTAIQLEAAYRTDDRHRDLKQKLIDLEYEYNLLCEACSSIYQKRDMIQEERALLSMGYFSRVSKTNGIRAQEKIQQREIVDDEIRTRVNQKRRTRRNVE